MENTQRQSLNQKEETLFSFNKTEREEVRISEVLYLNRKFIDFRIFAKTMSGEYLPTKKGITFARHLIPFLKEGLEKIK
jgi:hypothetical protein